MPINNKKLFKTIFYITSATGWSILGFKRGIDAYDYSFNKKYIKHNADNYFYTTKLLCGIGGVFLYINPVCIPAVLCKEIYRAEVDIRGLEAEKKKDFYNEIL
jgi:hypothetical protein